MGTYTFKVIIEVDEFEDGRPAYHAHCPALIGCHTWGYTYNEAWDRIHEAVSLYLEDLLEAGEEIPADELATDSDRVPTSIAINL